jgi:2-octaprenyl-6-methoxyphenol hydroxylase
MKNKILKYDFLIIGSGLIGSLLGIALLKQKFRVLVVDKQIISKNTNADQRTLAVNANSRDFLQSINLWKLLDNQHASIEKITIETFQTNEKLIFEDKTNSLGSVIYNKTLLSLARRDLIKKKALIDGVSINIDDLKAKEFINIKNQKYLFKKIILVGGKQLKTQIDIKNYHIGSTNHKAYVGFFSHKINHKNIAYENFTEIGPLAILPVPDKTNKKSTFIYSSANVMSHKKIQELIRKHFSKTHGHINLSKKFFSYSISPYLFNPKKKYHSFLFIGDSFRSIHPVAGQGWNLGIKDIQSLINLLKTDSLDSKNFNEIYYSRRKIESFIYFYFTQLINKTFEKNNLINKFIGISSLKLLKKFGFLRDFFVNRATGKN